LDWIGLDWIGLDWIVLEWIGLDWAAVSAQARVGVLRSCDGIDEDSEGYEGSAGGDEDNAREGSQRDEDSQGDESSAADEESAGRAGQSVGVRRHEDSEWDEVVGFRQAV
jgi:hypothetical protein